MAASIDVAAAGPSASVALGTIRGNIRGARNLRFHRRMGGVGRGVPRSTGQVGIRVEAGGSFVGTASLEVTLNGTDWVASAHGALAEGQYFMIPETTAMAVRANASAYTSGTLTLSIVPFR